MTDHPLLFRPEMIRALLEGRKTQTRRPAYRATPIRDVQPITRGWRIERRGKTDCIVKPTAAQRIKVGDRIWVRETWCAHWGRMAGPDARRISSASVKQSNGTVSEATEEEPILAYYRADREKPPLSHLRWTPSIHMPRWASRLTLIVTGARIERLQDILDRDALAEGVTLDGAIPGQDYDIDREWWLGGPRRAYRALYERIHGKGAWDANEEVVVVTFAVHKVNIDALPKAAAA